MAANSSELRRIMPASRGPRSTADYTDVRMEDHAPSAVPTVAEVAANGAVHGELAQGVQTASLHEELASIILPLGNRTIIEGMPATAHEVHRLRIAVRDGFRKIYARIEQPQQEDK
jgi:hypothetical protein